MKLSVYCVRNYFKYCNIKEFTKVMLNEKINFVFIKYIGSKEEIIIMQIYILHN